MSEDSSSLAAAASTTATDDVQTTAGNTMTSSPSRDVGFYFQYAIVAIGVLGAAANALVLYAMIASKVYKKQLLIGYSIRTRSISAVLCSWL